MAAQPSDLAVVGHFSVDTLVLPTRKAPFTVLGGAAAYTAFAAKHLDASASVISRVGSGFPQAYLWWLQQEGIDVSAVTFHPEEATTAYELTYGVDFAERTLKLKSKGAPLNAEDIPRGFRAKAIHLAPIANEISLEVAMQLKACADTLCLDPQGMTRCFDEQGNVHDGAMVDNEIFGLINIFKSSQNEIFTLTGESELKPAIRVLHDIGVETVIVTMGAKGSVLSLGGAQYNVAACPSQVVVDPTGAGDVFIGAFLAEYLRQKETLWCASVGSAAASLVVEGIGSTYFGSKEEVYRRANLLYEKELKQ
ncbi:MAG: carbohydrate kinase family protein [Candidatus Bathyarchaeota archaeon]|nr:carbohydrate kinase family protein [Candidatus Bathyarchaeota archaeon]